MCQQYHKISKKLLIKFVYFICVSSLIKFCYKNIDIFNMLNNKNVYIENIIFLYMFNPIMT